MAVMNERPRGRREKRAGSNPSGCEAQEARAEYVLGRILEAKNDSGVSARAYVEVPRIGPKRRRRELVKAHLQNLGKQRRRGGARAGTAIAPMPEGHAATAVLAFFLSMWRMVSR